MKPVGPMDTLATRPGLDGAQVSRGSNVRDAAREFEAVMLRQMVEALRRASKMGEEEAGNQMTDHLIEDALANHLAKAGGIGLADTLARAVEERGIARGGHGDGYTLPRSDMHLVLERGLRFTPLDPPPGDVDAPQASHD